jgi:hypothetical protein
LYQDGLACSTITNWILLGETKAKNSGNSQFTIRVSTLRVKRNFRKLKRLETVVLIGLVFSLPKEKILVVVLIEKGFSELIPIRTTSCPILANSS